MNTTEAQARAVGSWEGPSTVRELMSPAPVGVSAESSAAEALDIMVRCGIHHLPVLDGDGTLCGLVSEQDLLVQTVPGVSLADVTLCDVMQTRVETASPDEAVSEAAGRMAARRIGCLPVVEADGRLVGILTCTDVLAERGRLLFKGTRGEVPCARTLMTAHPLCVRAETDVISAVQIMVRYGIRHLPVVGDDDVLTGMVSERDLRTALGYAALSLASAATPAQESRVAAVMSTSPVTVRPEASLFEVARHFVEGRRGAVVVVDEARRVLGIVSYVDLIGYLLVPGARRADTAARP